MVGVTVEAPAVEEDEDRMRPVALTRDASELRRLRDEHGGLIASIPATEEPATPTAVERQEAALARVMEYPDGEPVGRGPDEDWFDLEEGLVFYRDNGGDWTARRVRESHSHRDLFYYKLYPDTVPNFRDKTIYGALARELAFEAHEVMPVLGDPTPAVVRSFARNLGWELRDTVGPVVNLWTTFTLVRDGEDHRFAVGGVMRLGVAEVGKGEDRLEYLTVGEWIGPVVVERLR